jgi:hypothetical protein
MDRVFPDPDPLGIHFSSPFFNRIENRPGNDKTDKLPFGCTVEQSKGPDY